MAPVNSISEAVADEQYRSRGAVVTAEHPTAGTMQLVGALWAGAEPAPHQLPDLAVTDTAALLAEAGYDRDRIAALVAAGVIA